MQYERAVLLGAVPLGAKVEKSVLNVLIPSYNSESLSSAFGWPAARYILLRRHEILGKQRRLTAKTVINSLHGVE